jgi:hypothetical protein
LRILGSIGDDQREFVVAIGEAGHDTVRVNESETGFVKFTERAPPLRAG